MNHNQHAKTDLLANNKGFTLIEIIVGMMILSVVMMSAYTMFSSGLRISGKLTGDVDVRNDIRKAGNQIVKDIQQSTGVAKPQGNFVFSLADGSTVSYYYDPAKQAVMRSVTGSSASGEITFIDSLDTGVALPFSISRDDSNENKFLIEIRVKNNNKMAVNPEGELHSFFAVRRAGASVNPPPPPPGGKPPPAITAFDLLTSNNPGLNVNVYGNINQQTKEIFIYYPYGVILTSLVPTIQITGTYTSLSPHQSAAQNFFALSPVITYRVHYGNNEHVDYLVSVRVGPDNFKEFFQGVFVFGSDLIVENNAKVFGLDGFVYVRGSTNTTSNNIKNHAEIVAQKIFVRSQKEIIIENNATIGSNNTETFIDGPTDLLNEAEINGTTHINGNFRVESKGVHGTVNVKGNVELYANARNSPGTINYTGTLTNNSGQGTLKTNKVNNVPSFQIPPFSVPSLQPDSWYVARGYTSSPVMRNNMKFFDADFNSSGHGTFNNVIIVSKKDIKVGNHYVINNAIFFAPNGIVEISNGVNFTGIIIAKDILIRNQAEVTFQTVNISDLPF